MEHIKSSNSLLEKYNTRVPRYTSYPTVPHWNTIPPTQEQWFSLLRENYKSKDGFSLYIHLPFCEALCTYCGCNKRITKNHAVESPYINAVIKEWKIYLNELEERPIIREIHLGGGTPTFFSPSQLNRLISTIIDTSTLTKDADLSFEAHPSSTTYEHLSTLKKLGFSRISIGVQDVSPEILKAINRHQTIDQINDVTNWARSLRYTSVNYDIIYGLPFQQDHNITQTIKLIADNKPDRIALYSYAHVPWKSTSQRAFTINDIPKGQEKARLFQLSKTLLKTLGYKSVGMDHFCLEDDALYQSFITGNMHRKFMGYTPNFTKCSIALGTSSISDAWNVYVQNEKKVETYQEIINTGKLPIIKGHLLSNEETLMRKTFLDLMCKNEIELNQNDKKFNLIKPYLENLTELSDDGLVKLYDQKIKVTEKGQLFIRNICSSIDPLFQNTESTKELFSSAI